MLLSAFPFQTRVCHVVLWRQFCYRGHSLFSIPASFSLFRQTLAIIKFTVLRSNAHGNQNGFTLYSRAAFYLRITQCFIADN